MGISRTIWSSGGGSGDATGIVSTVTAERVIVR
jgi:hypothetical protein